MSSWLFWESIQEFRLRTEMSGFHEILDAVNQKSETERRPASTVGQRNYQLCHSFMCVWLPGRMGAHHREGELIRGSSGAPPSSCWTLTQPGPPATTQSSERKRRVCVASSHILVLLSSPVCAWICIRPRTIPKFPSRKGTAQSPSLDRAFRLDSTAEKHFSIQWRRRKKGWLTGHLFKEMRVHVFVLTRLWRLGIMGRSNSFYLFIYTVSCETPPKKWWRAKVRLPKELQTLSPKIYEFEEMCSDFIYIWSAGHMFVCM